MTLKLPVKKGMRMGVPEAISAQEALTVLTEANIFEQEQQGVIDRFLLKEEIQSLKDRVSQLIQTVEYTPAQELSPEVTAIRTALSQALKLINGLYENPDKKAVPAETNSPSTETSTFTREDQEKFAVMLLTPLKNTTMNPEILGLLKPEYVFIGDIITTDPDETGEVVHTEFQRVMQEIGAYDLVEKFAKAHQLTNTSDRNSHLNGLFFDLKQDMVDIAWSLRDQSSR